MRMAVFTELLWLVLLMYTLLSIDDKYINGSSLVITVTMILQNNVDKRCRFYLA
jgi:hypothetical protein